MIDKIRLREAGTLREDLLPNMGKGFDATCCAFLRVDYGDVVRLALAEADDEKVLAEIMLKGRELREIDGFLWNQALSRRGWRDDLSDRLQERLTEGGWADRSDIKTFFDYIDLDEGRPPKYAVS
jgi:hypothetical protein